MKWTDAMVRLLITAVSYIGEDVASECGGRRKFAILQKKGKWKAISKVMAERGCYVSPQQCEDKFNDLNKRYKRLTDILGRGTSCKVVENPALLEHMNISEKLKEDARKILSSKHLFYEEMCSYHNCNRLNLPEDPTLQRSLQLALRSRDEHDTKRSSHEDIDEDDQSADSDDEEGDAEEHNAMHGFPKRMKLGVNHEELAFSNCSGSRDCNRSLHPQGLTVDMNQVFPEGSKSTMIQQQWVSSYPIQLEEKRLHIQAQMLELERQRYKWQRFSKKKDRELNIMRMENERMELENKRLSLELQKKELELNLALKKT
ncbi:aspartic proteinase [Musa troglodytarum]|uniref:Aspartic proteinase n=1 Tax=Musa troglodytarum TaxID=320322 RepID=A0A9E7I1Z2_9LILI|nr:aspartic proteinase [Musa troglodytarum]URE44425.1 aspartic proteinase [Musa troglodytarum]